MNNLKNINENSEAVIRHKQYVIENSVELRELKAQLQAAHNRRVLEAKISWGKTERQQEEALNNQAALKERKIHADEACRLRFVEGQRRREEKRQAELLLQQMHEKREKMAKEQAEAAYEAKLLEEKIFLKQAEESRQAEQQKLEKEAMRVEQEAWLQFKQLMREEEQKREDMQTRELQERVANTGTAFDHEVAKKRQQQLDELEKRKDKIGAQLEELSRIRQIKENLKMNLLCSERLEKEREEDELTEREIKLRREAGKQHYDVITRGRRLAKEEDQRRDWEYAAQVNRRVSAEQRKEKEEESQRRQVRTAIRSDNRQLADLKDLLKRNEQSQERAALEQTKADEEKRLQVIKEERLRLLSSFDRQTLSYLPRYCLNESDLIDLEAISKDTVSLP